MSGGLTYNAAFFGNKRVARIWTLRGGTGRPRCSSTGRGGLGVPFDEPLARIMQPVAETVAICG
jgi:hypothetical protein